MAPTEPIVSAMVILVLLAFIVERALSVVFEHYLYVKYLEPKKIKEFIAVGTAFTICYVSNFDIIQVLMGTKGYNILGVSLTALCIAGGSKIAIRLFQDVLGVKKISGSSINNSTVTNE